MFMCFLLCLELGRLATRPPRGPLDRTPAPPRPPYAVAPSVSSKFGEGEFFHNRATSARYIPRGDGVLVGKTSARLDAIAATSGVLLAQWIQNSH